MNPILKSVGWKVLHSLFINISIVNGNGEKQWIQNTY
jgi:hypothetical protein